MLISLFCCQFSIRLPKRNCVVILLKAKNTKLSTIMHFKRFKNAYYSILLSILNFQDCNCLNFVTKSQLCIRTFAKIRCTNISRRFSLSHPHYNNLQFIILKFCKIDFNRPTSKIARIHMLHMPPFASLDGNC